MHFLACHKLCLVTITKHNRLTIYLTLIMVSFVTVGYHYLVCFYRQSIKSSCSTGLIEFKVIIEVHCYVLDDVGVH